MSTAVGPRPHRKAAFVPAVVTDWAALDESIDSVLQRETRAPATVETERRMWDMWTSHCATVDADPLQAPYVAFVTFCVGRGETGLTLNPATIDRRIAAICSEIRRNGHTPAIDDPAFRQDWSQQITGLRALFAARHPSRALDRRAAVPLLRDDLIAMLATDAVGHDVAGMASRAVALTTVDTGVPVGELMKTTPAVEGGTATWGPVTLVCDHDARHRGIPWDCSACTVRTLVTAPPETCDLKEASDRLVRLAASGRLESLLKEGAGSGTRYRLADGDAWQRAGARRALVASVSAPEVLRWLRARAWTASCWCTGQPMSRGMATADRGLVTVDLTDGVSLPILEGTRTLRWSDSVHTGAAECVVDYLAVRDALLGEGGPFIVATERGSGYLSSRFPASAATPNRDLTLLAELVGLPTHFTSLSPRLGFNEQASLDGWTVERRQAALGHEHVQTTMQISTAHGGKGLAAKLLDDTDE